MVESLTDTRWQSALQAVRARARAHGLWSRLRFAQRLSGTPYRPVAEALEGAESVLDVGCGFGALSGILWALGHRVHGVDVDAAKLAWAKALFPEVQFGPPEGSAEGSADGVVFHDVLHHLPDADAELRTAWSALRPRGVIVVKENDTGPLGKRLVSEGVEFLATGAGITQSAPVRFRSAVDWGRALAGAGFTVERVEVLNPREGWYVPHCLLVGRRP